MRKDVSPFEASARLHWSWLSVDVTLYDFAPEGEFLVSIFHSHNFLELLVVQSGKAILHIEDEAPIALESGSLVFLNQHVPHMIESDLSEPLSTYLILFSLSPRSQTEKIPHEWVEDEMRILDAMLSSRFLCGTDDCGCLHELEHITQSSQTRNLGELVKIKNYMSNLLMGAFQSFTRFPIRRDFDNILLNAPILNTSRITRYIREHFTENISLTSVAESLFYSPRQCQRIIQESLGISFSDYVTDLRLAYAKKLLATTGYCTEKIAECAGFKNGKSFTRLFQAREGITPYRYRKEQAGRAPRDVCPNRTRARP